MHDGRVAVLGAGLQGTGLALELAARGYAVDLFERDPEPLGRASRRNEGKIHLGFVYAMDPTLSTARTMLAGALSFHALLARWTGGAVADVTRSRPFDYVVPRDSMRSPAELGEYYGTLERLYAAHEGDYLGARPRSLWWALPDPEHARFVSAEHVQGAFRTEELSIALPELNALLIRCLHENPRIALYTGHAVERIERDGAGFVVTGRSRAPDSEPKPFRARYAQVVNCLWDGRLALDAQLGLLPKRPWVFRLKHRVMVELPAHMREMPSMTFVLGAYGDIVTYDEGLTYVSWYPECRRGFCREPRVPESWQTACRGELSSAAQRELGQRALDAFDRLIPGLARASIVTVDAGVIFAWGKSDIDQRDSELHLRDQIGVSSEGGYHSVNTGKLTTAPRFAVLAADRVCAHDGAAP